MKNFLVAVLILLNCGSTFIEGIISSQGSVLEIDGARFEIVENSIAESTLIRIEKRNIEKRGYERGYQLKGTSFVIRPETLFFEKPIEFSIRFKGEDGALGVRIGKGFVPIAGSEVVGETLRAKIWHGGEYYVISKPEQYGIIEHSKTEQGLLIVSDIYVSDYIKKFKKAIRQDGYDYPIWTFTYSNEKTLEENAVFLRDELKKLHEQYGDFRLDIVSFGIGGLITHRYIADAALYQRDVSPAVIAIGTPFFGSNFASLDSVKKATTPYRFFFIDAMVENTRDLRPESEFISWIKNNRIGGHHYDDLEENKNFASIRGKSKFTGSFAEEYAGDGLVSLFSTRLTPLEPEPFPVSHFDLYEDKEVLEIVGKFVKLYRAFNWPLIFDKLWKGDVPFSTILELWEEEKNLYYRGIAFEQLLELNENMLKSVPEGAILITNGDNDTYPAWYVQEKRGFRKDVLIVNRSLFNLKEYVLFLQKKGLSLDITEEELDMIKHKKVKGEIISKSDQLIKLLVKQEKRPVIFSTTVYAPERYGFPLKLVGVVYEIGEGDIEVSGKYVDIDKTKKLFHEVFSYEKFLSVPFDSLSEDIISIHANHAAVLHSLAIALKEQGNYEEALGEIQFAQQFVRDKFKHFFYYNEALLYSQMDKKDKVDSVFKKLLEMTNVDLEMKKQIARHYYEMDMREEAIKVLADCLKDNPEDKEIPGLVKKYQEEL